jgi:cyclic nucleotide-binding protein
LAEDELNKSGEFKIGEYLVVSKGAINNVVEKQFNASFAGDGKTKRIGELLVEEGILTQEELDNSIRQQRIARLASCPIFATLSSMELASLSNLFTEISYPPNETFIMQGEEDPSMFIIASGLVEVFHVNNAGDEISIAKVGAGETIGEMGYFEGGMRTAYVRTLETTQLIQAQYKDLTNYFENVPRVALAFTAVVTQRKKEMDQLVSQNSDI